MKPNDKPTQAAAEYLRAKKRRDESAREMERQRIAYEREERNLAEAKKTLEASVTEDHPLRVFETRPERAAHESDPSVLVVQWSQNGVTITATKPETSSR